MIPLDENRGFYVGLPIGFDLSRAVILVETSLDEVAASRTVPCEHLSESAHIPNGL